MAISTYTELQTAVANWLAREDLSERIPEFISLAEAMFNRDIKHRHMERRATSTLTAGDPYVALPLDYNEARAIILHDSPRAILQSDTLYNIETLYGAAPAGRPERYTIGSEIRFGPTPDATYTVELVYYADIPSLSEADPTNWLLANNPDVYLFGTLIQAECFLMNDERIPLWGAQYNNAVQGLTGQTAKAQWNGGPLRMTVDVNVV